MKEIVESIKNELAETYANIDELVLEVLFSNGHIICSISINDNVSNVEISVEQTVKISEYVQHFVERHFNRMTVKMVGNEVSEHFDFSKDYYISSNEGLLYDVLEKYTKLEQISSEELKSLLLVAKHAISKTDINDLISNNCKLYLVIESHQLVTDISPNVIKDSSKYLFLCEISADDICGKNFENLLLCKIEGTYQK